MKRSEFIVRLQARFEEVLGIKISKKKISEVIDAFLDEIFKSVVEGQVLRLKDFGAFYLKPLEEREGYSIEAKQKVTLPATTLFKFKSFDAVKKKLNVSN